MPHRARTVRRAAASVLCVLPLALSAAGASAATLSSPASLRVAQSGAGADAQHPLDLAVLGRTPTAEPLVTSTVATGYTPAQVRAYLGLTGTGAGQTVAVVTAYDAPNVVADLGVFNATFGLPPVPSFRKVNQTGGTKLPALDAGWALETALDVQWVHAVAPAASILLVEASSSALTNLLTAVTWAAKQPGVTVVSNSWGGAEFSKQVAEDYRCKLTTGVCVVASGDKGNPGTYPATNPWVLAVGGTTLGLDADRHGHLGDRLERARAVASACTRPSPPTRSASRRRPAAPPRTSPTTPTRRRGSPSTAARSYLKQSGWFRMGGTSAGAPQWAGVLAAANQLRKAVGKGPLTATDAAGGTPLHTALYRAGGLSDVVTGGNGTCGALCTAGAGYDAVTGLGSPAKGLDARLRDARAELRPGRGPARPAVPAARPGRAVRPPHSASRPASRNALSASTAPPRVGETASPVTPPSTATRPATPRTAPSWRAMLSSPLPVPNCAGGRLPAPSPSSDGMTSPTPAPPMSCGTSIVAAYAGVSCTRLRNSSLRRDAEQAAEGRDAGRAAEAGREARRDLAGEGQDHERPGCDGQAGADGGVAPDLGEVLDHVQQEGREAGVVGQRGQHRGGEGGAAQQRHLDDRRGVAARAAEHQRQAGGGQQHQQRRAGGGPADVGGLHEGQGEQPDRAGEHDRAEQVGAVGRVGVTALHQHPRGHGEGDQADRHVDPEDQPPVDLHEQPADDRSEHGREAPDRGPGPDGLGPAGGRHGGQQERQRRRHHQPGAARLQDAGRDEQRDVGRQRAQRRPEREDREAQREQPPPADPVGPAPCRHERRGEDHRVGVEHPRQRREAGLGVVLGDRRERQVDDEQVEAGHEHPQREHDDRRRPRSLDRLLHHVLRHARSHPARSRPL